jgi:pimeloyl-ACP methyl ester carboxylesterase
MASRDVVVEGRRFTISYEILNKSAKKDAIILHGWGSNRKIMRSAFQKELADFRHIYVDLPGFGNSTNAYVLDSASYQSIMEAFIRELKLSKDLIMGHSFGGKVATLLEPECLVLLSSAGIIEPKPLWVRLKIILFKWLKPLGGENLYKLFATKDAEGLPQHMYETLKRVVAEDFSGIFSSYKGRALVFWGVEDSATKLASGEKIAELIKGAEFFPLSGDHYFFINHAPIIAKGIESRC